MPTTKANATAILSAISVSDLIQVSLRILRPAKKRKTGQESGYVSSATVIGHYISFLKHALDEKDRYLHLKGHYLVMDNTPYS